jgi:DNA-binding XRE family transcriptional regulator
LRKESGASQTEFATAVGASPAAVSLWESGARSPRGQLALECWLALDAMRKAESRKSRDD